MRKTAITIALFILVLNFQGHTQISYKIFHVQGEVSIKRSDENIKDLRGELFETDDLLIIEKGVVSLVNEDMKRLTLQEEGTYTIQDVKQKFKKITASLENKYLHYLWKKVRNEKEKEVNLPGGVIRGKEMGLSPGDSVIILSDTLIFSLDNRERQRIQFILKNESYKTSLKITTTDSCLILFPFDSGFFQPGWYHWQVKANMTPPSQLRAFYIPLPEDRMLWIDKKKAFMKKFDNLPDQAIKDINEMYDQQHSIID